jgi:UDP-glucose 4-epimerase
MLQVHRYADAPCGDVLVHLAETSVRAQANAAGEAGEAEADATLEALIGRGYRRIVYVSSAVLYGDTSVQPHCPNDPPLISDSYTRTKRRSELRTLGAVGREAVVARLANVFGPGMSGQNVLSAVLQQLGQPGPVRVLDTTPVRDFVWAEDVADALARMALGQGVGVYNVGSGVGTSVRQLAEAILDVAGESGRGVESALPPGHPSHLVVDPGLTREAFGWTPGTTLRAGLAALVAAHTPIRP